MYKDFNTRLTKLQERAKLSNPRDKLKKLLQDINNLEKFYSDKEYRNTLVSANYPSSEYFELENILNLITESVILYLIIKTRKPICNRIPYQL